jgi:hypothetical protein
MTGPSRVNRAIRACRAAGLPVIDEQGCTCLLRGQLVVLAGSDWLRLSWPYAGGCPIHRPRQLDTAPQPALPPSSPNL